MAKKKKQKKKTERNIVFTWIRRVLSVLFMLVVFSVIMVAIVYGSKLMQLRKDAITLLDEKGEDAFFGAETSVVYDCNGEVLLYLKGERNSSYLEYGQIPEIVVKTFVVSEDRSFYSHSGIDLKGIARALWVLIKNEGEVTQGGSTITQQLARNIYLSYEVSIERKIKEMFIAYELEQRYDKDTIMEYYINNIYFANGLYGIEAAARGYFNKSVDELAASELIFLCAIPNNPTLYNPLENFENTLYRRNLLVTQLYEQGVIDELTASELKNYQINLEPGVSLRNNYVDTFVKYCATIELMEHRGFKLRYTFNSDTDKDLYETLYQKAYNECNSLLFTGGYEIYTSIDLSVQGEMQKILDEKLSGNIAVDEEGIYAFQGSSVCIDNETGNVVAIVGGRTADGYAGYTLNRAYQSFRQPGSSIKPVMIYAPLFERGYTPDTIVIDEAFAGGPKNYPNSYSGPITVKTAVAQSKNTIAWRLFQALTPNVGLRYLTEMGFSKIVESDNTEAAALGGLTYGTSAKEMAAAYAALANDGVYRQPTCVTRIIDARGQEIVSNAVEEKSIYNENAARMTTDVLKEVLATGTGKKYQVDNAICAGKTGTTDNTYDKWFVGYSRYYTVSVWCGYDYPKNIESKYDSCAGEVWNDIMTYLHQNKEKRNFLTYAEPDEKVPDEAESTDEYADMETNTGEGSYDGGEESTGGSYEGGEESTGGSYEGGEESTGGSYEGGGDSTGGSYGGVGESTGGSYEGGEESTRGSYEAAVGEGSYNP